MVPEGDVRTREGGDGNDSGGNKRTSLGGELAVMAMDRHGSCVCLLCENWNETTPVFERSKEQNKK